MTRPDYFWIPTGYLSFDIVARTFTHLAQKVAHGVKAIEAGAMSVAALTYLEPIGPLPTLRTLSIASDPQMVSTLKLLNCCRIKWRARIEDMQQEPKL